MTVNQKALALKEAHQALIEREATCAAAIQAVLAKYGCNLFPIPRLTQDGRIIALLEIRSVVE